MKRNIVSLFFLALSLNIQAQKATEKGIQYTLDTTQLSQLNLYMEALKEKSIGNVIQSLNLFNASIGFDPKNHAAYYEASKLESELNNFQEASQKAEKAYTLNKSNSAYRENYLEILTKTQQLDKAIDVMKDAIDAKQADDILKMQYAYLLSLTNKPKKAIAILEEFEKNGEFNEAISYEKIKIYVNQKDYKSAENEMKKMIKFNPNDTRFLGNLAEFYLKTNNIEQAELAFNDILRQEPNNLNALLYKVEYYQMKKEEANYRSTLLALMNNLDLNLDTKVTLLSEKFTKGDKVDSSEKIFLISLGKSIVKVHPSEYKSHQILADVFYINQNYDSARVHYKTALSIENSEYNIWQNLFYTLSSLKNYQEMADSTESAIDLFPANGFVYLYNGLANSQIDKNEKAEKSYKRALKFIGENKQAEAQIYSALGDIYQKLKKFKESDESFENSIKVDPNNPYTLNNFAYYLSLRKDKLDYARTMSKKSLDIESNNSSFLDTYAWINFQLEKLDEAKYYQEKAIEVGKDDMATVYEHYGDIMIKLNDVTNALKYWNLAKTNGSKNKSLSNKISQKKYLEYQD